MTKALDVAEGIGMTPALADVLRAVGMLELSIGGPGTAITVLEPGCAGGPRGDMLVSLPMLASRSALPWSYRNSRRRARLHATGRG